jgi:hypothetical protein
VFWQTVAGTGEPSQINVDFYFSGRLDHQLGGEQALYAVLWQHSFNASYARTEKFYIFQNN